MRSKSSPFRLLAKKDVAANNKGADWNGWNRKQRRECETWEGRVWKERVELKSTDWMTVKWDELRNRDVEREEKRLQLVTDQDHSNTNAKIKGGRRRDSPLHHQTQLPMWRSSTIHFSQKIVALSAFTGISDFRYLITELGWEDLKAGSPSEAVASRRSRSPLAIAATSPDEQPVLAAFLAPTSAARSESSMTTDALRPSRGSTLRNFSPRSGILSRKPALVLLPGERREKL